MRCFCYVRRYDVRHLYFLLVCFVICRSNSLRFFCSSLCLFLSASAPKWASESECVCACLCSCRFICVHAIETFASTPFFLYNNYFIVIIGKTIFSVPKLLFFFFFRILLFCVFLHSLCDNFLFELGRHVARSAGTREPTRREEIILSQVAAPS